MELNKYVVKVGDVLFNTVTKKALPQDVSLDKLSEECFLVGQEKDCIYKFLFRKQDKLQLNIVPTWKCDLRCTHCCVSHLLVKEDSSKIDQDKLVEFIQNYIKKYNINHTVIYWIGGEISLVSEECLQTLKKIKNINSQMYYGCSTNLVNMDDAYVEFLSQLNGFQVSVDGSEESHNAQRKVFDKTIKNPYQSTINNLKKLVKLGLREKIVISASLKDGAFSVETCREYVKNMLEIGILPSNISVGGVFPTIRNPDMDEQYKTILKTNVLRPIPCCRYRFNCNYQINPDNTIWTNYYVQNNCCIGNLNDSLESIEDRYKESIINDMPVLQDPKCMECPAIGFCWGGCTNNVVAIGNRPSSFCNQNGLIEEIKKISDNKAILKYIME